MFSKLYAITRHARDTRVEVDPLIAPAERLTEQLGGVAAMCICARAVERLPGTPAPPFGASLEWWFDDADQAGRASLVARRLDNWLPTNHELVCLLAGEEHLIMPDTPGSQTGPAIKLIFLFNRKPELTRKAFSEYWLHQHAPIVPRTPALAGYVQCHLDPQHCVAIGERGVTADAVTELYWPDLEAADRSMTSREMTEEQSEDSRRFVDRGSLKSFLVHQQRLI